MIKALLQIKTLHGMEKNVFFKQRCHKQERLFLLESSGFLIFNPLSMLPLCHAIMVIPAVCIIHIHVLVTFSKLLSTGFLSKMYSLLLRETGKQFKGKL